MQNPSSPALCPIAGISVSSNDGCKIKRCMNNDQGSCTFQSVVALEGQLDSTAEYFQVSTQAIEQRVSSIHAALVAASWFEFVNKRAITNGTSVQFDAATDPLQSREFKNWNSSIFNFGQIIAALIVIRKRL